MHAADDGNDIDSTMAGDEACGVRCMQSEHAQMHAERMATQAAPTRPPPRNAQMLRS